MMIDRLRCRSQAIRVSAFNPPFGEFRDEELDSICQGEQSAGPTLIWVGMSTPRQERLAVSLSKRFPRSPIVTIGAGFDFVAGLKPTAPQIVTQLCLERLFRLVFEPSRLFRRYAEIVSRFLILIERELVMRGIAHNGKSQLSVIYRVPMAGHFQGSGHASKRYCNAG
jgi:N-acetylglucosaminyldiphosphoundecaprenol N-acetyl-beta-D-mannosaminyltransferase